MISWTGAGCTVCLPIRAPQAGASGVAFRRKAALGDLLGSRSFDVRDVLRPCWMGRITNDQPLELAHHVLEFPARSLLLLEHQLLQPAHLCLHSIVLPQLARSQASFDRGQLLPLPFPQLNLHGYVLEAVVLSLLLVWPQNPNKLGKHTVDHVERRWQWLLRVLVLTDELGALKLPPQEALTRDATIGVRHLRDEEVHEDDGRDELVREHQQGHRHACGVVGPILVDGREGRLVVKASDEAPEGLPQRLEAENRIPIVGHCGPFLGLAWSEGSIGDCKAEGERAQKNDEEGHVCHHATHADGQHTNTREITQELEDPHEHQDDEECIERAHPRVLHAVVEQCRATRVGRL
mmetsp:Transcript_12369/g.32452  ORF Transcript_12369/g.32452 Transcript_12369/m.32452 type:complete len:350 (+) Transcript_12369:429-1478(+)